jgi:phosphoserine phosphatase RsbU/P
MFNKSIAYRLKLYISVAVVCVFLILITVNFLFNRKLLRENIENKAITLSTEVNSLVKQKVFTTKEVSQNIAEQIRYYSLNRDAEVLLSLVMNKYPFLNAIHVKIDSSFAFPYQYYYMYCDSGRLVFNQSVDPAYHCLTAQKVFDNIPFEPVSGWTFPYRCDKTGNVAVSYYTPVVLTTAAGGEVFSGLVISELSLSELNEDLNRLKLGDAGYVFLITRSGDYITHPKKEWILNHNMFTLPSKILDREKINLEEVLTSGKTVSTIAYPEHLNYKKTWAYFSPVDQTDWFLIFISSFDSMFSELYFVTLRLLLFALLGLVLVFLLIHYITNKLIEPLSDVTFRLTRLSIPAEKGRGYTKNEVKQVSDSLEYLKAWFEQYRIAHEQEEVSSLRQKQDLQQASEIQQSLIKNNFPAFPGRNDIDLHAIYKPAQVVSGDLFDYFFIDNDNLVFTIGDASGMGIPAAIFMSVAQTVIKNNSSYKKAKTIVKKANIELCTDNRHQYFLTLFLGVLNLKKGILNFCNAAHDFPFLLKSNGKITELKVSHGLPLGLYPERSYSDARIKLEKGDTLILYTDGVTDMESGKEVRFGKERLKEHLKKMGGLSSAEIVQQLNDKLENFKGEEFPQSDDICLFVIKYKP